MLEAVRTLELRSLVIVQYSQSITGFEIRLCSSCLGSLNIVCPRSTGRLGLASERVCRRSTGRLGLPSNGYIGAVPVDSARLPTGYAGAVKLPVDSACLPNGYVGTVRLPVDSAWLPTGYVRAVPVDSARLPNGYVGAK